MTTRIEERFAALERAGFRIADYYFVATKR